jgi:predicted phage terminase large subunit-like protein
VYVEDKASGIGLIQSTKRKGVPVVAMTPTKDKYSRALEATPTIEAGLFKLPDNATNAISQKVIGECEAFRADMSHKHDDICDMVCYAIEKGAISGGFF